MPEPTDQKRKLDASDDPPTDTPERKILDKSTDPEPNVSAIPPTVPYDPAKDREQVRSQIAYLLIWLLIGAVCVLVISVFSKTVGIGDLDKFSAAVLTPIIGLVGTVIGFYFGKEGAK